MYQTFTAHFCVGRRPSPEEKLSHVGEAVRDSLKFKCFFQKGQSWNISRGRIIGEIAQTPPKGHWGRTDVSPSGSHSDALPERMANVISRAQAWVDITSLSPPDGKFQSAISAAIHKLAENTGDWGQKVRVRLLFGNIVGMPVDCPALLASLTAGLPEGSNIEIWVGSYRKGLSWNHSKIIAVDGHHLFTGGHNMWDAHYLQGNPTHDLSIEAEGQVAEDGHIFANAMWKFICDEHKRVCFLRAVPGWMPCFVETRVSISQWPKSTSLYPRSYMPIRQSVRGEHLAENVLASPSGARREVPIISCGRLGQLKYFGRGGNASDIAITAMLNSANKIIRMSLQDLGPLTLPLPGGVLQAIPGGVWPDDYLKALATAMYDRGVRVEIVLSNPYSVPGNLSPMTANYGNGWSCNDVAAEIVKRICEGRTVSNDAALQQVVKERLCITYLRTHKDADDWPDGGKIGNHSKFFIVDDCCYYLGSQNLYIADLAEWGVIVDSTTETLKILSEYWDPMWAQSYVDKDCDYKTAMANINVNRTGDDFDSAPTEVKELVLKAKRRASFATPMSFTIHDKSEEEYYYGDGTIPPNSVPGTDAICCMRPRPPSVASHASQRQTLPALQLTGPSTFPPTKDPRTSIS